MNKITMYGWIMAASMTVVVAVTLTLCLTNLSAAGMTVLWMINAAAAVTFSICPTLADRVDRQDRVERGWQLSLESDISH